MKKNILSMLDTEDETEGIIDLGIKLKKEVKNGRKLDYLKDKTLAMIFERASTRTRVFYRDM
jgi:ornithine carbamoyltransferase